MHTTFPRAAMLAFSLILPVAGARAQHAIPEVTLIPAIVESGSPELIRLHTSHEFAGVEGEWLGHKLQFFPSRDRRDWFAFAGTDLEAPSGPSQLTVKGLSSLQDPGRIQDLSTQVEIHPAHYRTAAISVEPKFVEPGPEALNEIDAESKLKQKLFATSADRPLWSGSFEAPVKAKPTDSFGTRRTFNGKLASIHKGTDFRAASGTPVVAGNSGKVILAQPLYYEGNCVMIDHGLGLTSISMHLSRIDVKPGQQVAKGQRIGLSGATGRVTGPHLHWAIRWDNTYLDPAKLLRLNLNGIH